jgi:NADPH:quinone reductase-like Zn-dependent oxidoreductase
MMRASIITSAKAAVVARVAVPRPEPGELRVRIEGCGVCGSSLPMWEGRPWFSYPADPGAPGHEGWGTVDQVGGDVTTFAPGDRVALLSYRAFAEHDVAPAASAVRLPGTLSGPFPGEALGCAFNIFRRSAVEPHHTVVIVGTGFIRRRPHPARPQCGCPGDCGLPPLIRPGPRVPSRCF